MIYNKYKNNLTIKIFFIKNIVHQFMIIKLFDTTLIYYRDY